MTHKINNLLFGNSTDANIIAKKYGEKISNELNGVTIDQTKVIWQGQMHVEYVIDITETEYEDTTVLMWGVLGLHPKYHGYQYRAMKTVLMTGGMGAVWFKYDVAPIEVHYSMSYQPWSEFLVHMCAIIGGTFAAAGMLESIMRNGFGACFTSTAAS